MTSLESQHLVEKLTQLDKKHRRALEELSHMSSAQKNLYKFQEKIEQQKTIYLQIAQVGHKFNQSFDLNEVFDAVSRFCLDLLNFEKFVLLLPSGSNQLEVKAAGGYYPIAGSPSPLGTKHNVANRPISDFLEGKNKLLVRQDQENTDTRPWREAFGMDEFIAYTLGVGDEGLHGLLVVGNSAKNSEFHRAIDADEELDAVFSNITSLVVGAQTTVKFMQAIQYESAQVHRLLNNMKQAVFSVDSQGLITEPVSRFAQNIFSQAIVSTNVFSTIFQDLPRNSEAYSRLQTAFTTCFGEDELQWMLIADDFPTRFNYQKRTLRLNVQPIYDDKELLEKLMFVVEDVTEIEKLEAQISKERFEIEMIQQILRNDLENVKEFFSQAVVFLSDTLKLLTNSKLDAEQYGIALRTLHTLKGNARLLGFAGISKAVHECESVLIETKSALFAAKALKANATFIALFEKLGDVFTALHAQAEVAKKVFNINSDFRNLAENFSSDIEQLCSLSAVNSSPELTQGFSALRERLHSAKEVTGRTRKGSHTTIEVVDWNLRRLQDSIDAVLKSPMDQNSLLALQGAYQRLTEVPLTPYFENFNAMVDEVSGILGKRVHFQVKGDASVPRSMLASIQDMVVQLLRNAIDHGLESPEMRKSIGKTEVGILEIQNVESNNCLELKIRDDGKGIDSNRIAELAIQKGVISQSQVDKLNQEQKMELIFLAGFSSKEEASDLSGRGVGLDIVKGTCERLGGKISIRTQVGKETEFFIKIPLTIERDHQVSRET